MRTVTAWVLLVLASSPAFSRGRPFAARDMIALDRISGLTASPDGGHVVFKRGRELWLLTTADGDLRPLTEGSSPTWAADSQSFWFLSDRSGSSQIWKISLDGSDPHQVSSVSLDVEAFVVSPDGSHFAFTSTVPVGDSPARGGGSGRLYDRLFVRHWKSWNDGRRTHLFVTPASGGDARDVSAGVDADVTEELTFTPDGLSLVFSMKDVGRKEAWSVDYDLYVVPVDGSAPPRSITDDNDAWDATAVFSPDGGTLAYLAMRQPGYESDRFRIIIKRWPDGEANVLTEDWDRSPNEIVWSHDGKEVLTTASNGGQTSLFAINAKTGDVRTLLPSGTAGSPTVAGERVYLTWDDLKSPPEIYEVGSPPRKVSSFHEEALRDIDFGEFESFTFAGWNGETVSAYVVKPVGLDPSRRYPVVLLIHGGPQGSFGNHFQRFTNPQIWAGAGYATLMIDFHGSVGYGQAFTDSIRGDYGGKPFVDLMKGLDAALARYPWMDPDRVAAVGRSFAGYMVNWIAGQAPDRFRCFVSHAGRVDERTAYLSTDELWFPEWDHGGTLWDHPEGYETFNPFNYVAKWKTPMLLIHGGEDYRVAIAQSISTFTALQRRGIPSQFLYFPDEGHAVSRPKNVIQWHDVVGAWLRRYLGGPEVE